MGKLVQRTVNGNIISPLPTETNHLANKEYVDLLTGKGTVICKNLAGM